MVGPIKMVDLKQNTAWRVIGKSVIGASHERSGKPNQDAIACFPDVPDSLPLIVAVADGHGGTKYFRSEKGANFAVEAARETLLQFEQDLASLSKSSSLEERLTKSLVNAWRDKVKTDLKDKPFTNEDLSSLEEKEGTVARQLVEGNPILAYGATILVVMVTASFIAYLQLGDGDILIVSEQGQPDRVFPLHEKHFANETTSLCSSNAWNDFQFCIVKISPNFALPALILLSTDGYKDSFSSNEEFCKVGSDLFEMIRSDKLQEIEDNLPSWLSEASLVGSGDDITLGMLYRMDAFEGLAVPQSIEQEHEDHTEGESLERDTQSGHCHGSLQLQQTIIWDPVRGEAEKPMDC